MRHSFPFTLYRAEEFVGFARVISDRTTFAYLADVFIEPAARDAHGLYARLGFAPLVDPAMFMWRQGGRAHD